MTNLTFSNRVNLKHQFLLTANFQTKNFSLNSLNYILSCIRNNGMLLIFFGKKIQSARELIVIIIYSNKVFS